MASEPHTESTLPAAEAPPMTDQPATLPTGTSHWLLPLLLLGIGCALLVGLYWETVAAMVQIWWRSDTFAHGFLILPISLYLVAIKRDQLVPMQPTPSLAGLLMLALCGIGWLAASMVDVQVVQQLALVGMLISMTWALLGNALARALMFPLGFLFFMVPVGEFLIQPMMEFTAVFSVYLIRLTDIPVYWEGFFISLPSGDWSIVEGCSGVRYLIASIAVGFLYAYLFYYSFWRRAAFVLLAIVAPIIANGFRAFMIIMIGHFSDMKLATGVDHLVYGWVFFGLVIMLMFWIGSFWWDSAPEQDADAAAATAAAARDRGYSGGWWAVPLAFGLALTAPLLLHIASSAPAAPAPLIPLPQASNGWVLTDTASSRFKPAYKEPTSVRRASYRHGDQQVELFLYNYRDQRQGAELVNSQNVLVAQKHAPWQMRETEPTAISLNSGEAKAIQSLLRPRGRGDSLLAWNWYWIDGAQTINPLEAKLREGLQRLTNPAHGGFAVVLVTVLDDDPGPGHETLQGFVDAMWPSIETSLQQTR